MLFASLGSPLFTLLFSMFMTLWYRPPYPLHKDLRSAGTYFSRWGAPVSLQGGQRDWKPHQQAIKNHLKEHIMHVFGLREKAASGKSIQALREHAKCTHRSLRQVEPTEPHLNPLLLVLLLFEVPSGFCDTFTEHLNKSLCESTV